MGKKSNRVVKPSRNLKRHNPNTPSREGNGHFEEEDHAVAAFFYSSVSTSLRGKLGRVFFETQGRSRENSKARGSGRKDTTLYQGFKNKQGTLGKGWAFLQLVGHCAVGEKGVPSHF